MGWGERLATFFSPMAQAPSLAAADTVRRLVPGSAEYVTAGPVVVLPDAAAFVGGPPGQGGQGRDLGAVPDQGAGPQQLALLVLAGRRLCAIAEQGEVWSTDVRAVTALDAHRRSGFVIFLRDGSGLAVGTQTPVQVPSGASFSTVRGVTNALSGWDTVLEPYGVQRFW